MGYLDTLHEEVLSLSLESEDYFGKPITLRTRDGSLTYDVTGSISKIMPKMEAAGSMQPKPVGKSVAIAVRYTTLLTKAGYPDNVDWVDSMPTVDWLVDLVSPWTQKLETFTIERGSIAEDEILPIWETALTVYQE